MSKFENRVVAGLPWLSAAGAVAMTGLAVAKWPELDAVNRVAFGLDAAVYAAAALPLARRRSSGWWALYLATLLQPVFGCIEVAQDHTRWPSAVGRTVGAMVVAAGLLRLRRNYG